MLFLPMVVGAQVEIDGIYYNLDRDNKEAEVTNKLGGSYEGKDSYLNSVGIPTSVIYDEMEYRVTSIGDCAFYECSDLTSVTIPNSVTSIGESAFNECSGLISVSVPNSVMSIGNYAFAGCKGLTSVTIPNSVMSIGDAAFFFCSGLTSVTIPNSVMNIGYSVFCGCRSLTSIIVESDNSVYDSRNNCNAIIKTETNELISGCKNTAIPNGVTSIGYHAFFCCYGLISITIPNSVTSIGHGAFGTCIDLTHITIPNSVTSIDSSTFYDCIGLISVTIPNSVKSIGGLAFCNCSSLTSVTIPNSVTNMGGGVFIGCSSLTSVTIPNSVTSIESLTFQHCSSLTSVTIPNSVTSIGDGAFENCSGLTSVTIPNSVTSIGDCGFDGCSGLTSVTIPNGVTSIGDHAFSRCSGLTNVYCLAENVPTMKDYNGQDVTNAFESSPIKSTMLHVPAESVDAYKAVEPWKSFKEIVAIQKCDKPNIIMAGNKIRFECETPGATFKSELAPNIEKLQFEDSEIVFQGGNITYTLTVIASAPGYEDSDPATLTLTVDHCDVNKDGTVDVADIATIISRMAGR